MPKQSTKMRCRVAVVWIDWYPYHVARFCGLVSAFNGEVAGIELVGGIGVHAGLKFREEVPEGLPVTTLLPNVSWGEASHLRLAWMVWQELSRLEPEVVLVPGYYTLPGLATALWARVHGAKSVLMTESCAFDHARTGWREKVKSFGLRMLFSWAVTGGRAHVAYLRQLGFPLDRVTGFYDVVDNTFFGEGSKLLRKEPGRARADNGLGESPYFLYVGRLAEEKNVTTLLTSWIAYRNAGGSWPLVLVGEGPESGALRELAAACKFGKDVVFPGLRSAAELLPFYAFAGCFVLPSWREPWGLVVNEAMAAGLPVLVSTRCGCAADLLTEGRNGFSFEPLDEARCTTLLLRMESLTAEQRAHMGAASARAIEVFSPQSFGQSIFRISMTGSRSGLLEALPEGSS